MTLDLTEIYISRKLLSFECVLYFAKGGYQVYCFDEHIFSMSKYNETMIFWGYFEWLVSEVPIDIRVIFLQNGTMKDFGYREGKCLDLVVEVSKALLKCSIFSNYSNSNVQ